VHSCPCLFSADVERGVNELGGDDVCGGGTMSTVSTVPAVSTVAMTTIENDDGITI
jgi:hypothetical protein